MQISSFSGKIQRSCNPEAAFPPGNDQKALSRACSPVSTPLPTSVTRSHTRLDPAWSPDLGLCLFNGEVSSKTPKLETGALSFSSSLVTGDNNNIYLRGRL